MNNLKSKEKLEFIAKNYIEEIGKGTFGNSGDFFITTRELAKENEISLEYANKVMNIIVDNKTIMLLGKHYYITKGQIKIDSPMHKKLKLKKTFGMIVSNLQNAFISGLVNEVANIVENCGYSLLIQISDDIDNVLNDFLECGVSGIFIDPFIAKNYIDSFMFYPLPIVFLGFDATNINRDSIIVDNYSAGKIVADLFFKIGCKKFVYFGFEQKNKHDKRFDGFNDRIKEKGKTISDNMIFILPKDKNYKYDIKLLKNYINTLIWKTSSYDKVGIFCYHDLLAYDVVNIIDNFKFLETKRKIPDNFSIVGFDNLYIASIIKPSLTTVDYPLKEIATKGLTAMLDCLNNPNHKPDIHKVLCTIIERNTTK